MRRAVAAILAAFLWAAPWPARAAETAKQLDLYVKLAPVVLEYWDARGLFHIVNMELVMVVDPKAPQPARNAFEKIQKTLQAINYEDLTKENPGILIKATALDVVRGMPNGEAVKEILIAKLLFR